MNGEKIYFDALQRALEQVKRGSGVPVGRPSKGPESDPRVANFRAIATALKKELGALSDQEQRAATQWVQTYCEPLVSPEWMAEIAREEQSAHLFSARAQRSNNGRGARTSTLELQAQLAVFLASLEKKMGRRLPAQKAAMHARDDPAFMSKSEETLRRMIGHIRRQKADGEQAD